MHTCWHLGNATVHEVQEASPFAADRNYRTILTFLSRMTQKGYLDVVKRGNVNFYTPALSREEAVGHEIRCFLSEVITNDRENLALLRRILKEG